MNLSFWFASERERCHEDSHPVSIKTIFLSRNNNGVGRIVLLKNLAVQWAGKILRRSCC